MRHGALAAEVRHRHDRAAAGLLHQRLGRARARDERVRADVEREPEAVARRVGEAALEILGGRERDRVDEDVELAAERLADLGEDARDVVVRADVARGDERGVDRGGELAHALLDPLALVGERELRAAVGEPLRDRPRDRALVRDAEDERPLSLEMLRPCARSYGTLRCLAPRHPASRRLRGARLRRPRRGAAPAGRAHARLARPRRDDAHPRRAAREPRARDRRRSRCRRSRCAAAAASSPPAPRRKLDVAHARRRGRTCAARAPRRRARSRSSARAIPQARVGRRFQVVLDALTVSLPAAKLPALLRQRSVAQRLPERRVHARARPRRRRSSAPTFCADDRRRRHGHQDRASSTTASTRRTRSSTRRASRTRPASRRATTKCDDAEGDRRARRSPARARAQPGQLAVDPGSSFHGTHVAGIAAGDAGTTAPAGADHPTVTGLSGVAPRAWLGNYRVFTVPTPIGHVANTPEIVAAFEAAVKDGMDVINFSGGGPQIDPANDALVAAVHNVAAAGVVPVISAGNDRDDFGTRLASARPGTAPDAISVAAVSNTHVFAPALDVTAAGAPGVAARHPVPGRERRAGAGRLGERRPDARRRRRRSSAPTASRSSATSAARPAISTVPSARCRPARSTARSRSSPRALPARRRRRSRRRPPARSGSSFADNREGEANVLPITLADAGRDRSRTSTARGCAPISTAHGGRTPIRVGRDPLELETGRSGVDHELLVRGADRVRPRPQARRRRAGRPDPLLDASAASTRRASPSSTARRWRRRTSPARRRSCSQLHPAWTPAQVKSALVSTAGPAWGDTARTQRGARDARGRRPRRAAERGRPAALHRARRRSRSRI